MFLMGIVGWWTYFEHKKISLEEVNHYEEYLGPILGQ